MFYVPVTGWLLASSFYGIADGISAINEIGADNFFRDFMADWQAQIIFMAGALLITVAVCMGGVRKSVEKVIKYMMGGLFVLLGVLVVRALTLEGAGDGVKFFLMPDPAKISEHGWLATVTAALSQAFFTLSLGIGSIAICGSYFGKERSLPNEGLWIVIFDTLVAVCAGLIIFPSCYAYNVAPGAGPSLIFITLPLVFQNMAGGWVWGSLFFLFLTIAAFSTLVAVFENLAAFGIDELKWSRKKSCTIFGLALAVASLPCVFGFNILSNFHPLGGTSNILDLEDFIVSDNLLPLGALVLTIFCTRNFGWGQDNFYTEINTGKGLKFPRFFSFYLKWILPLVIFAIWLIGICKRFFF
jgi:NSS family neurotransmitter:Na+ symporter